MQSSCVSAFESLFTPFLIFWHIKETSFRIDFRINGKLYKSHIRVTWSAKSVIVSYFRSIAREQWATASYQIDNKHQQNAMLFILAKNANLFIPTY